VFVYVHEHVYMLTHFFYQWYMHALNGEGDDKIKPRLMVYLGRCYYKGGHHDGIPPQVHNMCLCNTVHDVANPENLYPGQKKIQPLHVAVDVYVREGIYFLRHAMGG
jgi:hypothetical protein